MQAFVVAVRWSSADNRSTGPVPGHTGPLPPRILRFLDAPVVVPVTIDCRSEWGEGRHEPEQ